MRIFTHIRLPPSPHTFPLASRGRPLPQWGQKDVDTWNQICTWRREENSYFLLPSLAFEKNCIFMIPRWKTLSTTLKDPSSGSLTCSVRLVSCCPAPGGELTFVILFNKVIWNSLLTPELLHYKDQVLTWLLALFTSKQSSIQYFIQRCVVISKTQRVSNASRNSFLLGVLHSSQSSLPIWCCFTFMVVSVKLRVLHSSSSIRIFADNACHPQVLSERCVVVLNSCIHLGLGIHPHRSYFLYALSLSLSLSLSIWKISNSKPCR